MNLQFGNLKILKHDFYTRICLTAALNSKLMRESDGAINWKTREGRMWEARNEKTSKRTEKSLPTEFSECRYIARKAEWAVQAQTTAHDDQQWTDGSSEQRNSEKTKGKKQTANSRQMPVNSQPTILNLCMCKYCCGVQQVTVLWERKCIAVAYISTNLRAHSRAQLSFIYSGVFRSSVDVAGVSLLIIY